MAELPYIPFWTDAYMADCSHLSDAEHGRYLLLLIHMWRAPKLRIPNDDQWLSRKFNRPVERVVSEIRPLITEFCQCDGNWITQKRLAYEFERVTKTSIKQSDRAKSGWEKRKGISRGNAERHAPGNASISTSISINNNKRSVHNSGFEAEFEEQFWPLYPRKVSKGSAKAAFARARMKAELPAILDGVRRLVGARLEERFTPHASTWLNGERWLDQTAAQAAATVLRLTPDQQRESDERWLRMAREQRATGSYGGKILDIPRHITDRLDAEERERRSTA